MGRMETFSQHLALAVCGLCLSRHNILVLYSRRITSASALASLTALVPQEAKVRRKSDVLRTQFVIYHCIKTDQFSAIVVFLRHKFACDRIYNPNVKTDAIFAAFLNCE